MSRHVVSAAILAGIAACTLAACTVGGAPLGGAAPAANTTNNTGAGQVTSGGQAAGGSGGVGGIPGLPAGLPDLGNINVGGVNVGGSLPAGFPTPPGAGVTGAVGAEGNIAAQIQVADPTSAYNFWLAALPGAGYSVGQRGITTINGVVHAGINFSGHGYQPSSAIAIVGTLATLGFEGGGSTGGGGGVVAPPAAGGGATITVEQPNVSQTLACSGGNTVYIQGPSDSITLTGSCGSVNVTGAQDTVVIDSAAAVNLTGVNDDVTVHTGNPQVSKTGENDSIHFG